VIRRRLTVLILVLLLAFATSAWYWLLHTESGARWIWARVQSATDGALQAQLVHGDLGSGLTIRGLSFSADATTIEIVEARLVVDVDVLPLSVQVSDVAVHDAVVDIRESGEDSQSKDLRLLIENLSLPLPLVFTDVRADNIVISGVMPENDVVLTEVTLAGSWHDEIVIDRLVVDAPDTSAELGGVLALERPFITTFSSRLTIAPALTGYSEPVDVRLNGEGNLDKLSIDASSLPVEMSLQGSVENMLESLSWDLQAELVELTLQFGENDTEVRIAGGRAASNGAVNEYSLMAAATIEALDIEPLRSSITGKGTSAGFELSELSLRSTDADLTGSGRIAWSENWSIESQLDVATFNLNALLDAWPADHPIRGRLSFRLDEEYLAVSDSYLVAGDTDMSVRVDAELDLAASVVAGDLRWENALWPVAGDELTVSSKSGQVSVEGTLDDWRIDGRVEVGTAAISSGQFQIDGRGDRHHVEGSIIESELLGGNVSGYAAFNWRDQQDWSAGINLSNVDIGSFIDGWPGFVSGRVDASGQVLPFELDLQLSNINGALRDGPYSANGHLTLAENRFTATELTILHGDTSVAFDGDLFARSGLTFDVSVNDVSVYLSEADGAFDAAGSVSLHAARPSLRIDATSSTMGFREILASDIEIVDRSSDDSVIDARIKAERVVFRGDVIEDVTISLVVDAVAQSLQFDASHGDADIHLFVAGEFDDFKNPRSWQGQLREVSVALDGESAAEMSVPAALSLSGSAITIDRSCLAASTGMRLCAQGEWLADHHLQIGADLTDVPVNLINGFVDTRLEFDQLVSGNFEWLQSEYSETKGNADITISAGTIVSVDRPDLTIETDTGLLNFNVVNGQLLSGHATLPMPGFGHFDAQFSVPDVAQGQNSDITGLFDIDLSDVALAAAFLPLVDEAHGVFRADLALSGTVSEPQLVGDLSISNGSLTFLPIGLRLDQVDIASALHNDGQIELSGTFRAGDGRGEIVTRADYATTLAKGLELELRGKNLTLINVPDVQARADADVRIGYDHETLTLGGRVFIPHARVRPSNLTITRDSVSDDVVIVAGELPDDPSQPSREQQLRIAGSLEVAFGDDIVIDLGRATANITGSTIFSWEHGLIPMADGRYDLTGSVQAFGQILEITEGGLRFPKIPADNPFIRVRAEREIYGNPQVKTAGVLVDGTLRRPSIEAYTNPLTTEERALTLLVTGSDFDFEQGVGAIDFGTYIAPRIFVSYGVGLFETENVIRVRYDLMRGFGITATSGQKESGVDLNYRIER
jgi:translocation and assembly module TamB